MDHCSGWQEFLYTLRLVDEVKYAKIMQKVFSVKKENEEQMRKRHVLGGCSGGLLHLMAMRQRNKTPPAWFYVHTMCLTYTSLFCENVKKLFTVTSL